MSLQEKLVEHKINIIAKWVDLVLGTYAKDGAVFFKKQKDRFANPIGYNVEAGLSKLYGKLAEGESVLKFPDPLLQLVKLRAVQDFKPSKALSFFYGLKDIAWKECEVAKNPALLDEWRAFEKTVDAIALMAFDLFMADRELLYQVKVNDFKRGNNVMSERGVCPSALMRTNKEEKKEPFVI